MYFSAKKDIWVSLFIWGFIFFIVFIYIFGGEPIGYQIISYKSTSGYVIGTLMLALLIWIWFGTGYKIERGFLTLRFGPFRSKIRIEEIKEIRKAKKSGDRLELYFGKYDVAIISPKNKSEFIGALLAVNPSIQINEGIS